MIFPARWALLLLLLPLGGAPAALHDKEYAIKTASTAPPQELNESIRNLLSNNAIQFFNPDGKRICELWFCKELAADATPEQVKNGLTLKELKESLVLGAVRFDESYIDYRKQKVKAGVYTLRLGFQPADGDHSGKSTYTEFVLITPAAKDTKPDLVSHKYLAIDMSSKSSDTGHPVVFMLFPNPTPGKVHIEEKARDHWVIYSSCPVTAAGMKSTLGFGLTVVGEADD